MLFPVSPTYDTDEVGDEVHKVLNILFILMYVKYLLLCTHFNLVMCSVLILG